MADTAMAGLLRRLRTDHPQLTFQAGDVFCWSPADKHITYRRQAEGPDGMFSLLHEMGHALLEHKRYELDYELLELEVAAWERAKALAQDYGITMDEDHIQDCLDTYRDWLFRRSVCPSCSAKALQHDDEPLYSCFNCHATWRVTPSRFCRPYRQQKGRVNTAVFALEYGQS